jgi:hypothetical protein
LTALRFQSQIQEQQQEGPEDAPAGADAASDDGPKPDGWGDDALIEDILGDGGAAAEKPRKERPRAERPVPTHQEEEEPEDATPPDDDEEQELPPAAEDDDEEDAAAEDEPEDEELGEGDLAAAREALKVGDLDKAFLLAFGKKPEEVAPNPHAWTKWRQANEREDQRRAMERRAFEGEVAQARRDIHADRLSIHQTIEALKPYEKFYLAEQAWRKEGDPARLVDIITGITAMSYDEAQKIILTKTRRSPAERAMAARLAELEQKLTEKEQTRTAEELRQAEQQQYANDIAFIRQSVSGEVAAIPKFDERIYRLILKTRGPLGNTLTIEQAAARIVKAERKRIASHPFIKKKPKPGVPPQVRSAARTLAARNAQRPALRRNSQNNGASTAKEETTDDIVADILSSRPRRRSA